MENKQHSVMDAAVTRPLSLDLDLYTEGDEEYKKELGALLIKNLREMREALPNAVGCNDLVSFDEVCHKVKVTLSMLNDIELNRIIDALRDDIRTHGKGNDGIVRLRRFLELCDLIIVSLTKEVSGVPGV